MQKPPATFIWHQEQEKQTEFILFSRTFELASRPAHFEMNLFADSRYRLWANGQIVGYGPARFHRRRPEFDTYDLASHLTSGSNRIVVEVRSVKEPNFQMDVGPGGFVAWGGNEDVELATPGDWRCRKSLARSSAAPLYSFAMPRTEILDVAAFEKELASADSEWDLPKPVAYPVWGDLHPRSVPMLPFHVLELTAGRGGPLADDEQVFGFHYSFDPPANGNRKWISVAALLISPCSQRVELALFWGRNFLNGRPLNMTADRAYGNRETARVELNKGVNLLYSEVEGISASWGYQLGFPKKAQIEVFALPGETARLLVSEQMDAQDCPSERGAVPATVQELSALNIFQIPQEGLLSQFPARENGWIRPQEPLITVDLKNRFQFPLNATGRAVLVMDIQTVFTGHPTVELECSGATTMDLSYSEVLRPCGLTDSYRCHHLVNSTDRYIVPAGRHRIEVLPERGGRYLQITVFSKAPVCLLQAGVRLSTLRPDLAPPLEDAPESYKQIAALCRRTLLAGYAECFTDSPWREQGMYLGDHYVQYLAMRSLSPDDRVIARCLRLFAACRLPDGLLPAVCPGHYREALADFTLIWILLLEEWALRSGDLGQLAEFWPEVEQILDAKGWLRDGPLVGARKLFICWGIPGLARGDGGISAALSAFYAGALEASARMAALLGKTERSVELKEERDRLQQAYIDTFWSRELDAFAPVPAGKPGREFYSSHVNILALLYNLAPPEKKASLLARVETDLRNQLCDPLRAKRFDGHVEYYFLFYTFRLLAREGRHELIEEIIRVLYGLMLDRGQPTLWENYCTGLHGLESQCHGWASSPLVYFSEELLGVRYPDPQQPGKISIRPTSATLRSCAGIYPHACGNVQISWKVEEDLFRLEIYAPEDVDILDAGGGGAFAGLQQQVNRIVLNRR